MNVVPEEWIHDSSCMCAVLRTTGISWDRLLKGCFRALSDAVSPPVTHTYIVPTEPEPEPEVSQSF